MASITVAVCDYGSVGKAIMSALLARDAKVVLISSDISKLQDVPTAVKATSFDYANETQVTEILKENTVDVVTLALGGGPDDRFLNHSQRL